MPLTISEPINNSNIEFTDWFLSSFSVMDLIKLNPESVKAYESVKTLVARDFRSFFLQQNKQILKQIYLTAPKSFEKEN